MKDYRILVPLDGSPLSKHTIESMIALKEHISVPLTLLHVLDISLLASRGFPEITFDQFRPTIIWAPCWARICRC